MDPNALKAIGYIRVVTELESKLESEASANLAPMPSAVPLPLLRSSLPQVQNPSLAPQSNANADANANSQPKPKRKKGKVKPAGPNKFSSGKKNNQFELALTGLAGGGGLEKEPEDDPNEQAPAEVVLTPEKMKRLYTRAQQIADYAFARYKVVDETIHSIEGAKSQKHQVTWNDVAYEKSENKEATLGGLKRKDAKKSGKKLIRTARKLRRAKEAYLRCYHSAAVVIEALSRDKEFDGVPVYTICQGYGSDHVHWYVYIGNADGFDPLQENKNGIIIDIWGMNLIETARVLGNEGDPDSYDELRAILLQKPNKESVTFRRG